MAHSMFAVFGLDGGELLIILAVLLVFGGFLVLAVALGAALVIRSINKKPAVQPAPTVPPPEPVAGTGKQVSEQANMAGSIYRDVNLAGAEFDNVNLTNARFNNVDFSNASITAAQMGGAVFKHIGPPPSPAGTQERQRPVRFEEMMLCDSTFRKVDLTNVRITDCDVTGMSIDGILVNDLLAEYRRRQMAGQERPASLIRMP